MAAMGRVSSPGEFHPEALVEPYVNVSIHTAPIIQPEEDTKTPMRKHPWMVAIYLPEPTPDMSEISSLLHTKQLCLIHGLLPFRVDPIERLNDATPLLHRHYSASSLLRVAPPLCSALVLSYSWC